MVLVLALCLNREHGFTSAVVVAAVVIVLPAPSSTKDIVRVDARCNQRADRTITVHHCRSRRRCRHRYRRARVANGDSQLAEL